MEAEDASWESTARSPNSFFKRASYGVARVRSVIIEGRRDELCKFLGVGG